MALKEQHLFIRFLLGCFPPCGLFARTALLFLLVQPLADLLRVPLVVESEQAGENLAAGGLADGEAQPLARLVEAVARTATWSSKPS